MHLVNNFHELTCPVEYLDIVDRLIDRDFL